nr:CsbD family protein [Cylindrospermum sp. FACHB-282]
MRLTPRAKAVTTNVEGKTQNAIGNITGNLKDQAVGTAKQVGAGILHTVEDVKDKVKEIIN